MSQESKTSCLTVTGTNNITAYDWVDGEMAVSRNPKVSAINTNGNVSEQRLYMSLTMPQLPPNALVKKVELVLAANAFSKTSTELHNIGVYEVVSDITTGDLTPEHNLALVDYEAVTSSNKVGDEFKLDITALADRCINDGADAVKLMLKIKDTVPGVNIGFYGMGTANAPRIEIEYETDFSMNTMHRTNSHSIGRFGQGIVDIVDGRLFFTSEDFSWGGNRMPVSISHQYSSALSDCQYSNNSCLGIKTADFSAIKLGLGWKLNLMQSMVEHIDEDNVKYYIHTDSNGNQTYFKESVKNTTCCSNTYKYNLFEDVDGNEMYYDYFERKLTMGETVNTFDECGRLTSISDGKNTMSVTYASNRISAVTDGAGRKFEFTYTNDGYLWYITAPDSTKVHYSYTNNLLTGITYPDGTVAVIEYINNKPTCVTLNDASKSLYKVGYTFNGDKLASVTEYGVENGQFVEGTTKQYTHFAASNKTQIVSTVPADSDEDENTVITSVYTFDDEGNTVGEYVYGCDGEKAEGSVGSGINPLASALGVESNVDNLLLNHAFDGLTGWAQGPSNCVACSVRIFDNERFAKFGKNVLGMSDACCGSENLVYQDTVTLPAGEYTLSAYVKTAQDFESADMGAYVRAEATDGTVICESEHIYKYSTEYTRIIAPFTLETAQSIRVCLCTNGEGSVYFNGVQLEKNAYANSYNLLQNSNFERELLGWNVTENAVLSETECFNMAHSLAITSDLDIQNLASQKVAVKSIKGTRETFTLSGWAKSVGLPNRERTDREAPQFNINAVIKYADGTTETHTADFSPNTTEWQPAEITFVKEKYLEVRDITINCDYSYNTGTAYFDDIRLFRTNIETDLAESDFANKEPESYTVNEDAEIFEEATDAYGNMLTSTTHSDGEFGTIYSSYDYSGENEGNDLSSQTDSRGNVTHYTVDANTSRNKVVTDRCGNKTEYTYDTSGRTTEIVRKTADGTQISEVDYRYDNFNNITEIARGDGMAYSLMYNGYHKLESIGITNANSPLVSYTYKNDNGRLKEITYANGYTMKTVYNSYGQIMAEKWFDEQNNAETPAFEYKYTYDSAGNLVRSIDTGAQIEYNYTYENGRIVRSTEVDISALSKTLLSSIEYAYDKDGYLCKKTVTTGENVAVYKTEYPENASPVTRVTVNGKSVGVSHSKTDSFGRKVFDEIQTGSGFISRQFSYHAGQVTEEHKENGKLKSSPTTSLVSQITLSDGRAISYEYDAEERITRVADSIDGIIEYTYDALGQLLTETVNDTVVNAMTYDNYGNILTKNGVEYTYGDENWKDLLTAYNGQSIAYDEQGNPTSYLGHTLTWEKGRQLKTFDSNTYTYNASGVRTSKTVGTVRHTFMLDGAKIVKETWGNNTLTPFYNNEESVCGIIFNGTAYYFLKNLQGDIIAITNAEGETVARYTYDAWGKCTITQDTTIAGIATVNPFRYRGYYLDTETGLYYLNSRYYDPETARFLNSDSPEYVSMQGGNLYAYCNNIPTGNADYMGFCSTPVVPGSTGNNSNSTFWAGFGIQIEFSGSLGLFGGSFGIEFIWYVSNLVSGRKGLPYAYYYGSISGGVSSGSIIDDAINSLIKNPSKMLSENISISASICALAIWGYKRNANGKEAFSSPKSYLGPFSTKSATIFHVKGFYSEGDSCFAIGAGYDFNRWAISGSRSNYKEAKFLNKYLEMLQSIYDYIYNLASAIMA